MVRIAITRIAFRLALAGMLVLGASEPVVAGFGEGKAAYELGDYETAFKEFLPLAQAGDAKAQMLLGLMYHLGQGVPQDYAAGKNWLLEAAKQGNAAAQDSLGLMYVYGRGVPQDYAEAMKWHRKAAVQGYAAAQIHLGAMYEKGHGVPQDYTEAVKWFRKAAEQGLAKAQIDLGVMYEKGQGVPQDYAEAVEWYRKAAVQGDARAQNNLGLIYANGRGVPQDYAEAVKWFKNAAEQGLADAQLQLGSKYSNGQGVPQDYAEAVKWYRKAAEQDNATAQFFLGFLYLQGHGVPQGYAEAVKWYRKAAEQGHAAAQNSLGGMYTLGYGVPKDIVLAHMWENLAAAHGTTQIAKLAAEQRATLAKSMTPAQIAEAQKMAREWKPVKRSSGDGSTAEEIAGFVHLYQPDIFPNGNAVGPMRLIDVKQLDAKPRSRTVTLTDGDSKVEANNCRDFRRYKSRGAYPVTTGEMRDDADYELRCDVANKISRAGPYDVDFIGELSIKWLSALPASFLPMSGGIYTDSGFEAAKEQHLAFIRDRDTLTDALTNIESKGDRIVARILGPGRFGYSTRTQCWEEYQFLPIAKGDFTGDGVADLLVQTSRLPSDRRACGSGSGDFLGAYDIELLTRRTRGGAFKVLD